MEKVLQGRVARVRVMVALLAMALLASACGLKPGGDEYVFRSGSGTGGGVSEDGEGGDEWIFDDDDVFDDEGDGIAVNDADDSDPGAVADTGESGQQPARRPQRGQEQPDQGGQPEGQQGQQGQQAEQGQQQEGQQAQQPGRRQVRGSDRTGVTDDTIRLAAHAPVTGAAPLPARSFELAADLYWRWVIDAQDETVLGRTNIELTFADDRYQPSTAVQVCRQLAQNAFLLVGAGGTDQIQACGRFANQAGLPYFSAGVTTRGLQGQPWYFAFSMTYEAQGELLAQYVARNFQGAKVAAILTDTQNFDDAVQGWERGVQRAGIDYYRTLRHPRGDTAWYNTIARELAQQDVDVVYINTSPVDYIRFAQQAAGQDYRPQFVGVGITMGLNPVLRSGCGDENYVDGGIFFSPFPGLDWARQNAPDFFEAAERFGTPSDDLAFAIWGQSKASHELFKRYGEVYGNDLTREDFRAFVETQRDIAGGVFPPVSYSPDDHFGSNQVHVIQADCSTETHRTLQTFASSF